MLCGNVLLLKTETVRIDSVTASLDRRRRGSVIRPAIYYLPQVLMQEQSKAESLCGTASEQLQSTLVTVKQ